MAAAFVLLILGAGAAEAQQPVELVDGGEGGCSSGCPHRPTGYAVPGPGARQVTLYWTPATTGPAADRWIVYFGPADSFVWRTVGRPADSRSSTLTVAAGVPRIDVGVAGQRGPGSAADNGRLAVAYDIVVPDLPFAAFALDSASVDGATVKLTFSTTLGKDSVPAKGSFSVSLAGTAQTPTRVSVDGKTPDPRLVRRVV
ncbi:MAG: hypothetical protein OXH96_23370 [Spirochaetaceae bacterium]|nr:hypothetical protein [Spirochaetaceae bacterium]